MTKGLESLAFCCGYQDRIVIRTVLEVDGIGHIVKIGEVKPSKCDDINHLLERIRAISQGHDGPISHSVDGPTQTRRQPDARKVQLINAGITVATTLGWRYVSKNTVGAIAQVSPNTVQYHFCTMGSFKNAVMREAIRLGLLRIIAQGIIAENQAALEAPKALKRRALNNSTNNL